MKKRLLTIAILTILQPACTTGMSPETKKILTDAGTRVLVAGAAAAEAAAIDQINKLGPRSNTGKQPIPTR